jgi:hypothetical protein
MEHLLVFLHTILQDARFNHKETKATTYATRRIITWNDKQPHVLYLRHTS